MFHYDIFDLVDFMWNASPMIAEWRGIGCDAESVLSSVLNALDAVCAMEECREDGAEKRKKTKDLAETLS